MHTFMLLLYNKDTDFDGYSPEEMQQIVRALQGLGRRPRGSWALCRQRKAHRR